MEDGLLFVVDGDELHNFKTREALGDDIISALQNDLGVTVGETVLPIAHWEDDRTGPLSIALNYSGELVVLMMADSFDEQADLIGVLSTLEQWLMHMSLSDLGDLSGDRVRFVEGLRELSPNTPLALSSILRLLLINPTIEPDAEALREALPFSRVELLRLEALEAPDGTLVLKRAHELSDSLADEASLVDDPDAALTFRLDPVEITSPAEQSIDLTSELEVGSWPTIIRGSNYVTAELPLHFDSTGRNIESISSEMFTVGTHLAVVLNLDDYRDSPFETASIVRWDSSFQQRGLFLFHQVDNLQRPRTIHLFVETERTPNRVFYLGTADQLSQGDPNQPQATWLKLTAPIDSRRLAVLKDGALPSTDGDPSFSFSSRRSPLHADEEIAQESTLRRNGPAHAAELSHHWVPNV